jgi:hypothetical protein
MPHNSTNKTDLVFASVWEFWVINPLMAELNPSTQCCLPRILTGDFNF